MASSVTVALVVLCMLPGLGVSRQEGDDYGSRATEFCSTRKQVSTPTPRPAHSSKRTNRPRTTAPERVGLGYTVYKRSPSGVPVRIDPRQPLVDGDAIRVVLESNVDGYLYIFNTDAANQSAAMIYPQVRLNDAENFVAAHVPVEVPSRFERNPGNQWLLLADGPTVDRLYFVVSDEPLPGVPVADELKRWCGANRDCYWSPTGGAWSNVRIVAAGRVRVSVSRDFGQAMTRDEDDVVSKSVRLGAEAPPPSAIATSDAAEVHVLVASVDLSHGTRKSQ